MTSLYIIMRRLHECFQSTPGHQIIFVRFISQIYMLPSTCANEQPKKNELTGSYFYQELEKAFLFFFR